MDKTKNKLNHITLLLEIIGCNQHCKHCYIPSHDKYYKSLKEVKIIIDNYAEVLKKPAITDSACIYIHKEPTLYPDIIDLLNYAASKGIKPTPTLSTNGIGLVKRKNWREIISAFKANDVKGLNMSLFGKKDYHDWFTGYEGSYDIIIEAAKRAKSLGFWVHWNLFVTKDIVDHIEELIEEVSEDGKSITIPGFTNKWEKWENIHATNKEICLIPEKYQKKYISQYKFPEYKYYYEKAESEWIKICLNKDEIKVYLENDNENESKYYYLIEQNNVLYDHEIFLPEFEVGNIKQNSLRDIFSQRKHSEGYLAWKNSDLAELAQKYGDVDNERLYMFESLWLKWFLMNYDKMGEST